MQHNMYAVKLLFESVHCSEPDPTKIDEHYEENHDTLFEESIILVKANNLEDAHELGKKLLCNLKIRTIICTVSK